MFYHGLTSQYKLAEVFHKVNNNGGDFGVGGFVLGCFFGLELGLTVG
jgi:hypothetical protein